ncbi:hypothetical protein CCACVL1_21482 [Corchorus capsularis]|uniref:Uncharacterized protein n=1 Tax=Corchorus capsularis TaxID=210143 RepID=A0A1R3H5D0_COCAP|nr:hypothetical protein CCACVL1_21482 [Corchorus capsularis]
MGSQKFKISWGLGPGEETENRQELRGTLQKAERKGRRDGRSILGNKSVGDSVKARFWWPPLEEN